MKAFKRYEYGGPEVLKMEDTRLPAPNAHQVLVKVHSLSLNPAEWHILRGSIWLVRLAHGLFRPKHPILGGDVAGEVVGVGVKVKHLSVGDRVFGRADHTALGEYALLDESKSALIPSGLDYPEASSLPLASVTAMDALDQGGGVTEGSQVLINGASGGIGTLALQIAKARGAIVHGICSEKNLERVKALGADQVIDYGKSDYFDLPAQYDQVIDLVGNLDLKQTLPLIREKGVFVMVTYSGFRKMFSFLVRSLFTQKLVSIDAKTTREKLHAIGALVVSGKVQPVIDQVYDFQSLPKAFEHIGTRRAKGKIIVTFNRNVRRRKGSLFSALSQQGVTP